MIRRTMYLHYSSLRDLATILVALSAAALSAYLVVGARF